MDNCFGVNSYFIAFSMVFHLSVVLAEFRKTSSTLEQDQAYKLPTGHSKVYIAVTH